MFVKGLKEIQEKNAEAENLSPKNGIKYLFINEGDSATIRFLGDEEMIQTKIHEYEDMSPTGKKYRKAYCVDNLIGAPCKWCADNNISKNVYVFLVYVYNILHKTQNPALNTDSNAPKWEAVKQGQVTLYKEDVEDIKVLRIKFGKDNYLKNTILQLVDEYGTISDRDYKFSRTGSGKTTSYSFIPKDPSKTPAKVIDAKNDSPTLEDILIGRRKSDVPKESTPATSSKEPSEEAPVTGTKSTRGRKPKEAPKEKDEDGDLF